MKLIEVFSDGDFSDRVFARFSSPTHGEFGAMVSRAEVEKAGSNGHMMAFKVPGERHLIVDKLKRSELKKLWRALNEQTLRRMGL
jgi:hypothetical protein